MTVTKNNLMIAVTYRLVGPYAVNQRPLNSVFDSIHCRASNRPDRQIRRKLNCKKTVILMIVIIALLAVLVAIIVQTKWKNRHLVAAAEKLPGPKGWPLLGSGLIFYGKTTSKVNHEQKILY
jgi:hypothetical protein